MTTKQDGLSGEQKVITATELMLKQATSGEETLKYWSNILKEHDSLREELQELQELRAMLPQVRQIIELASKTECFRRMPCLSCDGKQALKLLDALETGDEK